MKHWKLWAVFVGLLLATFFFWKYFGGMDAVIDDEKRFEAFQALFSSWAFIGVIFAIFMQREELGLQRKQLEDTTTEAKGTKEALEMLAKAISKRNQFDLNNAGIAALSENLDTYRDDIRSISDEIRYITNNDGSQELLLSLNTERSSMMEKMKEVREELRQRRGQWAKFIEDTR